MHIQLHHHNTIRTCFLIKNDFNCSFSLSVNFSGKKVKDVLHNVTTGHSRVGSKVLGITTNGGTRENYDFGQN